GLGFMPAVLRRALAEAAPRSKVLVTLFQRGAVDGLSMVPPLGEPRYRALRPNIGLAASGEGAAPRLDDTFGLHPALSPLAPLFAEGALAVVHAVGSPDPSRSHFDAQDYLDAGTPSVKSTEDGWLNRTLQMEKNAGARPLRAVALQPDLPRSLRGRAPAVAMTSVADFTLRGGRDTSALAESFTAAYEKSGDASLASAAAGAFSAISILKEARLDHLTPKNGAIYPASPLGKRMKEIAQLIRADVGLEAAATDCGGWDTHAAQGAAQGALAQRLKDLGDSLSAFATDLGPALADVCLVTMTEFGRTVRENGTRGTDHGHGSVMLVLGGGVRGKRVITRWKSLADADLYEGRDLPATLDHRDVLAEALTTHLGVRDLTKVFPRFTPTKLGLF
ncbi:MAG TPA: DUF1501 domain-containing protein, partial [Thermoanaerobaculia bacterium]|nr:DUF1501 domain-containing protein [Thermoanaerobaculia bacterium]